MWLGDTDTSRALSSAMCLYAMAVGLHGMEVLLNSVGVVGGIVDEICIAFGELIEDGCRGDWSGSGD